MAVRSRGSLKDAPAFQPYTAVEVLAGARCWQQDVDIKCGLTGGFDVGSKFSWNVLAAYSFDFAVRDGVTYSGVLGYRA